MTNDSTAGVEYVMDQSIVHSSINDNDNLSREATVAEMAIRKAIAIAQTRFRTSLEMTAKGSHGDLVTDVDLLCEQAIIEVLRANFPDHSLIVEETQDHISASPWAWVIDPLDGTNNYAYGLPVWGISIALSYCGEPVLACVADGITETIITARKGAGAVADGRPFLPSCLSPAKFSAAAFWAGYGIDRFSVPARPIIDALAKTMRRTFENWAPTVDVGLYLQGGIDIAVGTQCSGMELPAVLLVLREAGARIVGLDGTDVSLANVPTVFIAGRPTVVERFLSDFQIGKK